MALIHFFFGPCNLPTIAMARRSCFLTFLALAAAALHVSSAFVSLRMPARCSSSAAPLFSSSVETEETTTLRLSLEKPLGMILEENEEGQAAGVFVKDFAEEGSALAYKAQIAGATLSKVGTTDVTAQDFDSIMELIVAAESTVDLEFAGVKPPVKEYAVGTKVTLTVQQKDKEDLVIEATVGDNLRQTLIDNEFEVYQGLKQKLGNCGGAGQCTFCAVDFIESEGWFERSEYEDQKLGKFPTARLACLNSIQGPATVRKTER